VITVRVVDETQEMLSHNGTHSPVGVEEDQDAELVKLRKEREEELANIRRRGEEEARFRKSLIEGIDPKREEILLARLQAAIAGKQIPSSTPDAFVAIQIDRTRNALRKNKQLREASIRESRILEPFRLIEADWRSAWAALEDALRPVFENNTSAVLPDDIVLTIAAGLKRVGDALARHDAIPAIQAALNLGREQGLPARDSITGRLAVIQDADDPGQPEAVAAMLLLGSMCGNEIEIEKAVRAVLDDSTQRLAVGWLRTIGELLNPLFVGDRPIHPLIPDERGMWAWGWESFRVARLTLLLRPSNETGDTCQFSEPAVPPREPVMADEVRVANAKRSLSSPSDGTFQTETAQTHATSVVEPANKKKGTDKPTHGDNFEWIRCQLGAFTFTPAQAKIIGSLWGDWERAGCGVQNQALLSLIGDKAKRVRDVFKTNPAWKVIIFPVGKKGMTQLRFDNSGQRVTNFHSHST
jgi:hypothetical protein